MSRTCVFIDGAYFQKVLEKDFGKPKIDFQIIGPFLAEGFEPFLRTYYYNCEPYQSDPPTQEERQLFANVQRFHHRLRSLDNFELKLGRLEFRGVDKATGERMFKQKRVDIQLAVDLLILAFSRQIATAIVLAGDSDFIPVFRAAKDRGVRLVLAHGIKNNPAHRDLINAADKSIILDQNFVNKVSLL